MRLDATFEEVDQALTKPVRVKYTDCPKIHGERVLAPCYMISKTLVFVMSINFYSARVSECH